MFVSTLAAIVLVTICVVIHYEALYRLTTLIPLLSPRFHSRIVLGVLWLLLTHTIEVWVFALGFYMLAELDIFGSLVGDVSDGLEDYVYFSFVNYTTLGYGDLTPEGPFRFLAGMEALMGLVLITWSASYMYVEMEKFWVKG